ncbi:hypothetical protein I203_100721 [Kwoniella mangroviensis CBS 8507]|uniref:uncharacterized protein n=1 Tax=Kwoniella mangroviensis CBS 8507 TaxID=1296122 RepID=UPI00080CCC66|nr:uncharacterized protein I203_06746 [Kwoniella mangroviensis CBS 8507]OCF64162.1 hypothetical protein I203_06746 [Kwoniella mangroviensis CBS 8507]
MVEGTSIEAGAGAGVETEKERDTGLIGTETNTVKLTRASRSRSRSRSPSHRHSKDKDDEKKSRHRRRRSRSRSYSSFGSSDSESESESESEDERRRRKRKERERSRDKEDREERRRRKEKKREKKAKKDSKRKGTASSTAKWGQHGIISEIDLPKRDSEFRAWLVEERKINPETISKDRTKKEFAVFVEDYNTATLPHEKYYDMSKYEFKMNMIRSGQTLPDETGGYDPLADMKAHSSSLRTSAPKEKETFLTKEKIAELRRVEAERTEIAKRRQMGLDVNKNLGVRMEDRL